VRTVTEWDRGKPIPPECKRLMRLFKGKILSDLVEWRGFQMTNGKLLLPTGQLISPQEILTGIALIEIQSELELKTSKKLLNLARAISSIKGG